MKFRNITLSTVLVAVIFSSCSNNLLVSQGGHSDISLTRNSSEYDVKRLKTINVEGKAFWGIPSNINNPNKNKHGMVVKFNGLNLGKSAKFLPILTMVGYSLGGGQLINELIGRKTIKETFKNSSYTLTYKGDYRLGLIPSTVIAVPIAGVLNNLTWNGNAVSGISNELNYRLVSENPDVDIFLNPKYNVKYNMGWWRQSAKVEAKVMGATLKTN